MKKFVGYLMGGFMLSIMFVIIFGYNLATTAYVCSILYEWFLTPYFSLPPVPFWGFAGISLFLQLISPEHVPRKLAKEIYSQDSSREFVIKFICKPWLLLFLGYIIKFYLI